MKIRDRIKDFRRVKASELRPSPRNWREHPEEQRDALRGLLAEIGFADALLARELPDGTLELINGHLRREESLHMLVPVLVLDVTEAEADKLLAAMDPLAGLAHAKDDELRSLLEGTEAEDASLREFLEQLARGLPEPEASGAETAKGPAAMHLRPHEHYDYVLVLARTTHEWNRLAEQLGLEKIPLGKRKRLGYGRGYPAERLLELLDKAKAAPRRRAKPARAKGDSKRKKGGQHGAAGS